MKKFIDTDHPGLRPLWLRILLVAICAGWGILEIATGSPFWSMIFLGLAAYCGYAFFIDFNPRTEGEDDTKGKE